MTSPLFVRPFVGDERDHVEAGLRSSSAFTLRRCQILLASARGEKPSRIAAELSCDDDTVREAIHAFHRRGLGAITERSHRPRRTTAAFDAAGTAALRELVREEPRACGYETSIWTLALLATECARRQITAHRVAGETVRVTLERAGISWHRAKRWIRSGDPAYATKKAAATD